MATNKDLFDELSEEMSDPFADIESTEDQAIEEIKNSISDLFKKIELKEQRNNQAISDIKELIRSEIAKIKPTQNIIERQVEQVIKHERVPVHIEPRLYIPPPAKVIHETRVEVPKKDTRDLVEKSALDSALQKIAKLEKQLEETDRIARSPMIVGGAGVIGIPPPEAATVNQVLTVGADKKAKWATATGGTGAGLSGYTVNNGSELKTFDATDTSLDELARIVGSIITDLQA